MTREDIIRMAREAGLHIATDHAWMPIIGLAYAQKFAELVRAEEREACAKVCEDSVEYAGDTLAKAIRARGHG
jgi:hypothetical protein